MFKLHDRVRRVNVTRAFVQTPIIVSANVAKDVRVAYTTRTRDERRKQSRAVVYRNNADEIVSNDIIRRFGDVSILRTKFCLPSGRCEAVLRRTIRFH